MIPWSCPQEETLILLVPAQALPTRIQIPYPHFQGYAGHRTAMHPGSAAWHAGGGRQSAITEGPDICVSAKGHSASHPSRQPRACRMAAVSRESGKIHAEIISNLHISRGRIGGRYRPCVAGFFTSGNGTYRRTIALRNRRATVLLHISRQGKSAHGEVPCRVADMFQHTRSRELTSGRRGGPEAGSAPRDILPE